MLCHFEEGCPISNSKAVSSSLFSVGFGKWIEKKGSPHISSPSEKALSRAEDKAMKFLLLGLIYCAPFPAVAHAPLIS